ncbi:hypothetical protein OIO90_002955 [Microbotryomycetes sp. JL221]|nr:hypothetical protein OIO90_002955 [Microbotryomycetes sp. JL221]
MTNSESSPATFETTNQQYQQCLTTALTQFRSLLATQASRQWKALPSSSSSSLSTSSSSTPSSTSSTAVPQSHAVTTIDTSTAPNSASGAATTTTFKHGISQLEPHQVTVHKRSDKGVADVVRATAVIAVQQDQLDLDLFRAVLQTPELRSSWDKTVEDATTIELVDPQTRITKTDYRLGWPASPRDTITISKTFSDATTLIDISTSLPRSTDEPAFLRPAPPYVRSHVHLLAWCLQVLPQSSSPSSTSTATTNTTNTTIRKVRISLFWQWSLKGAVFATHHQQIAQVLSGFVSFVRDHGSHVALVHCYGRGIELNESKFDAGQDTRTVEYAVVVDEDDNNKDEQSEGKPIGLDELALKKERKRLERAIELSLATSQGWDVRVETKAVGEGVDMSWTTNAESFNGDGGSGRVILRLNHAPLAKPSQLVRVGLSIQRLAGGKLIKVNGEQVKLSPIEPRDSSLMARAIVDVDEVASTSTTTAPSVRSTSAASERSGSSPNPNGSGISIESSAGSLSSSAVTTTTTKATRNVNSPAQEIASLLRRNYIYFTSLLQEPEAKWRHVTDSRGVTVTQLDSIDPTLTIYRAEARFVGVGVWDVFSTICTPGARMHWDKSFDGAVLLEDINELSSLWQTKIKAAWPVAPRDSVTIRTSYKSPSSVHIFSFSTDDSELFPMIPNVVPPVIRTQTDLYGWAIEALSPTTTQITLLDQSDPKGWSNKSWTPTQLVMAVAGVGDFSLKQGGPPVVTRLLGAKSTMSKYEHDKGQLKAEYIKTDSTILSALSLPFESSQGQVVPAVVVDQDVGNSNNNGQHSTNNMIECEIRCDCSTWSPSIDVVIDPPPTKVSCLLRHRLSSGGGLWITIEHDAHLIDTEERIMVTVRKGSTTKEKGSVTVNGSRTRVDVEALGEDEVKQLAQKKRVKASPIPLDQYSTRGPGPWQRTPSASGRTSPMPASSSAAVFDPDSDTAATTMKPSAITSNSTSAAASVSGPSTSAASTKPSTASSSVAVSSPLAQSSTSGSTTGTVTPTEASTATSAESNQLSKPPQPPPAYALDALAWLQTFHAEQGPELTDPAPGWTNVTERAGTVVRKKTINRISPTFPVYRGDKIVQGMMAEEIAGVVSSAGCRKAWDERVDSATVLANYGAGCSTSVVTTRPQFPFKGRMFNVASVSAQVRVPSASSTSSTSTVLFFASASYEPDETFDQAKVNPGGLLTGRVLLEGWILETLDPYTSSLLAIPSTRCTYVVCIDHGGSIPFALNSVMNSNLAKMINNVETVGKTKGPVPRVFTPDASVQIEGPLNDDGEQECIWKLGRVGGAVEEQKTTLLNADVQVDDGTFRALFQVGGKVNQRPPLGTSTSSSAPPSGQIVEPKGSAVSQLIKGELPRSASLILGSTTPAAPTVSKKSSLSDLHRKSSKSSLRSSPAPAITTGGSNVGKSKSPASSTSDDPHAHDLVVAEFIVDLKQYPHGYSISCSSSLIPSSDKPTPVSLDSLRSLAARPISLRATVHDAPLPSILTASLDSWKRHNHLVRVLVPTSSITHPVQDPLRDGKLVRDTKPEWFRNLVDHGALVEVRIVPLSAAESATAATASQANDMASNSVSTTEKKPTPVEKYTRVMFNGEKLPVASQKDSKAVVARLEDEDAPSRARKISRVPRKQKKNEQDSPISTLPEELHKPHAVAIRLLAPTIEVIMPDELEFPDPKSPGRLTPSDEDPKSPLLGSKSGSANASRRDTLTSESGQSNSFVGMLGAYPLSRLGSSMVEAMPNMADSSTFTKQSYSLSYLILVAVISFLLGSLLRSLLTPADYIMYNSPRVSDHDQVERVLMQAFDPERRWRAARRLLEIRLPWITEWNFIVAAVRKQQ